MPLEREDIERLYRAQARPIWLHLARETLDPELAFDITGEAFAVALEEREGFRGGAEEQAVAWLWEIARRRLANYRRRGKIERRALGRLGLERRPLSDPEIERVEELSGLAELRRRVAAELDRIPERQRAAVRLHIVEELSYGAVAARLGISEESARARVARGLAGMRGRLTEGAIRS